jgi:cob(I)alamin adenosyltransferase
VSREHAVVAAARRFGSIHRPARYLFDARFRALTMSLVNAPGYPAGMRIYTRTGDDGSTGLFGGARTSKGAPRVEAYGAVDECNAALGLARTAGVPAPVEAILAKVQASLFDLGAVLATPPGKASKSVGPSDADVAELERAIDALEEHLAPLQTFVLPGGSEAAARLHLARTVCRRAEREVVRLSAIDAVDGAVVRYLNRLSDLLFVQARYANHVAGVADVPWKPRGA